MLVILHVLRMLIWRWSDLRSRSRSRGFWRSENCRKLHYSTSFSSAILAWSSKMMVDYDSMGHGTQSTAFQSQISEFLSQLAVMWLPSSRNDDITRIHWVLSPRCLSDARSLWLWLRAHWRHLANTIKLVLPSAPRVQNPNGKSIGLPVYAQLTAESPYALQWATLFPKMAPSHGDLNPHLTHDSLGPSKSATPMANGISIILAVFALMTTECPYTLQWRIPLPSPQNCPFLSGSGPLYNTWFPEPTWVLSPNGISIGSAVFAGFTSVIYWPTDRPCYLVGNNRPHLHT